MRAIQRALCLLAGIQAIAVVVMLAGPALRSAAPLGNVPTWRAEPRVPRVTSQPPPPPRPWPSVGCGSRMPGGTPIREGGVNPVFNLSGRVRDPAIHLSMDAGDLGMGEYYELFFTHYRGDPAKMFSGKSIKPYGVRVVETEDWQRFSAPTDVTPPGFASPDAPVTWHGREVLAFQAYPDEALGGPASGLFFAVREGRRWSEPRPFLQAKPSL